MNIIITAGGTSERIDDVRTITNSSTGRLGFTIGTVLAEQYGKQIETIYYLHGLRAAYPVHAKIQPVAIEGVLDLQRELKRLLTTEKIDAVIHAMAVSDYLVHEVTTLDRIRGTEDPENKADLSGNKISSEIDDLVIHMKKSPKVISKIKMWNPAVKLVGFKLLSNVPHEELIDVGHHLSEKNSCDFVLANDLAEISKDYHRGYLIHKDKTYDTMETNEEIAGMIAKRILASV